MENNKYNMDAAVDIHSFNGIAYKCMNIWVRMDQIQMRNTFLAMFTQFMLLSGLRTPFPSTALIIAVGSYPSSLYSL